MQSRDRRNREGSSRAGAGCAWRRDGKGGGRLLHPVSDAESRQGPGRPLTARTGRPTALSGAYKAVARAAGAPRPQAGDGHGDRRGGRSGLLRDDAARRGLPREGRDHRVGHVSGRKSHHRRLCLRLRPGWNAGGRGADRMPEGIGAADAALQDRDAAAREPAVDRCGENGDPAGGCGAGGLFVFDGHAAGEPRRLLSDLYQ